MLNDKQMMREDLHKKLNLLPEEQLPEVVQFLEYLGKKKNNEPTPVGALQFAGSWAELDKSELENLLTETYQRREQAFRTRPER